MEQKEHKEKLLARARRVVIKAGSSILSTACGLNRESIHSLVHNLALLYSSGREVVFVTSGAIAAGIVRLGMRERPKTIPQRQAAAAVGQIDLMALYEECFSAYGQRVAQILLTHDDLADRRRYLNAKHTMSALLEARVIPIVNENDTVAVEELQFSFGDNDNLAALVATLVEADLLVILSDVDGLFSKDPRDFPDAELIALVSRFDNALFNLTVPQAGPLGRGGMASKLAAARKASASGIPTIIANGRRQDILPAVFDPQVQTGTLILPSADRLASRKHWIAFTLKPAGALVVDAGAYKAVSHNGRSLLPSGLKEIRGVFDGGECVVCLDTQGREFARGLANYSSTELERIKGLHTSQIEKVLGYKVSDEIIHRNDLVLL
jgi:glutamate 5-kinase